MEYLNNKISKLESIDLVRHTNNFRVHIIQSRYFNILNVYPKETTHQVIKQIVTKYKVLKSYRYVPFSQQNQIKTQSNENSTEINWKIPKYLDIKQFAFKQSMNQRRNKSQCESSERCKLREGLPVPMSCYDQHNLMSLPTQISVVTQRSPNQILV